VAIRVYCTNCNRQFNVADSLEGKRGKCPGCQNVLQVPARPETNPQPSANLLSKQQVKVQKTLQTPGIAAAVGAASADAIQAARPRPAASPSPAASPAIASPLGMPEGLPKPQSRQPSRLELQGMILKGLEGRIDDVELTGKYHFGLFLVACVMIAMVVAYLLVVVGAAVFIGWYVKFGIDSLRSTNATGSAVFLFLLLLVPLIVAVFTFVALIGPLFGRFDRDERVRTLTPQSDPLLYAFVERIAAAVGAPAPSRIDVTTDVNASAGFRGGLFSASRNELVLTLGLSLVAGLNTRQLAGVLAHELGHFTQKSSIRLTTWMMRVSMWFSRAADSQYWDYRFSRVANRMGGRLFLIAHLIRLTMKPSQWTFRGLLLIAYSVCGYMFRQQEFDADRFETRVGGSASFESTTRRLEVLNVAYRGAIGDLQYGYGEGRLGDNLPLLVLSNARQLPEKVHNALRKHLDQSRTRLFDSHPCPRQRIENAWKEQSQGIYSVELPAHLLFSNFLGLTRNATWDFYRGIFGSKFKQSDMHPTGDLLQRIEEEEQAFKTVRRYYQGTFTVLRPIRLRGSRVDRPADVNAAVAALKDSRHAVMSTIEAHRALVKKYNQADLHIVEATQARALFRVGRRVRKGDFSVPMRNIDEVNGVLRRAHARINGSCRDLIRYEEVFSTRLWAALQLMHVAKVADRLGNFQKLQEECHKLVDALAFLNSNSQDLLHLRNSQAALYSLFTQFRGHFRDKHLINEILSETKDVYQRLVRLRESLATVIYPFDHAKGRLTMAEYALEEMPDPENPFHIFEASHQFASAMSAFYPRLAGRLAAMAEKVENLFGMQPLPEPPEEKDDEDEAQDSPE
jgi:Zn-dependent protease with chaperone function